MKRDDYHVPDLRVWRKCKCEIRHPRKAPPPTRWKYTLVRRRGTMNLNRIMESICTGCGVVVCEYLQRL
jgi:hypothetical protein